MLLSLKDCWNRCVSIGAISVLHGIRKATFKLSGPGDLCELHAVGKQICYPWRVIFISGIDGYGDIPLSGIFPYRGYFLIGDIAQIFNCENTLEIFVKLQPLLMVQKQYTAIRTCQNTDCRNVFLLTFEPIPCNFNIDWIACS